MPGVFISHNHKDKSFVERLKEDLKSQGIHVWVDEDEMKVGDNLIQKIEKGIKDNDFVIGVISRNSIDSKWVQKELSISMNREISSKNLKVLPVRLDDCEMPPMLSDKIYADFSTNEKYDEGLEKLLVTILPEKKELAHVDNIIYQFEYSIQKDDGSLFESQWREVLGKLWTQDGERLKPRVLAKLTPLLKEHKAVVRLRVLRALGDLRDTAPAKEIIPLIRDENQKVMQAAIEALGRLRAQDAVEPLLKVVKTGDFETIKKAVEALGKIGDPRAARPLIRILMATEPLFSLKSEYMRYLVAGPVSSELRKAFDEMGYPLYANAQISGQYPLWQITIDKTKKYEIKIDGTWLKVFRILSDIEKETSKKAGEALVNIGEGAIPELVRVLFDNVYFGCLAVAEVLGKMGSAAVEPLIESLNGDNPEVQRLIVKALGNIRDKRATLPLLELLREGSGEMDSTIIEALGKIGDKRAVDDLLKYLESELEYERIRVIEALGEIGDSRALESLFRLLKEGDWNEKIWVLRALEKIGDARAVGPIFEHFKRETNSKGKEWRPWNYYMYLDKLVDESCLNVLGRFLQDDNEGIRELSAYYLKTMGKKSTEVILPILEHKDPSVRHNAIQLLEDLKDSKSTKSLVPLIKDPKPYIRRATIRALESIHDPAAIIPMANARSEEGREEMDHLIDNALMSWNDPGAIEPFIKLLKHPNKKVLEAAIIGLRSLKHEDAIEPLMKFQETNKDIELRVLAIRMLSDFKCDEAIAAIKKIMRDPDPKIRCAALEAIEINKGDATTKLLCEALRDPALEVRKKAVIFLSPELRKKPCILDALIRALEDDNNEEFKQEVARNIGKIGDRRAVDPLIKAFKSSKGKTRESILMALSELEGQKVTELFLGLVEEEGTIGNIAESYITGNTESDSLDLLIEAMEYESEITREFVAIALGRLKDPRALETLEKFAESPNEDVRYYVNWAIREIKWENLFSLDREYNRYLEEGTIKRELIKGFKMNIQPLNRNAKLAKINQDSWEVTDGKNRYIIVESGIGLTIYKP